MIFFSTATLKHGPWSPSRLKVLKDCSLKFKLEGSKFKLPTELEFQPDTTALDIGNSVHKYAELVSAGISRNSAISQSQNETLSDDNKTKVVGLTTSIDRFNQRVETLKKNSCIFDLAELKAAVDKDLKSVSFFDKKCILRGKIDRAIMLEKDGSRHIIAVDYKTGKFKQEYIDSEYSMQLETYGVLLHSMYPEASSVQPCLYYVEEDKLVWHTRKIYKSDITESNPVFTELNNAADEYDLLANPEPNRGRQCDWCKYKLYCNSK